MRNKHVIVTLATTTLTLNPSWEYSMAGAIINQVLGPYTGSF